MGPLQATNICLQKTLVFSGRASRSEFWWFAPVGVLAPLTITFLFQPITVTKSHMMGLFLLQTVFLLPFLSAASRRARDAGYDQGWAGWGFGSILFGAGIFDLATSPIPNSPKSWMIPSAVAATSVGLSIFAFIFTRPSHSGPNPHEVTQ